MATARKPGKRNLTLRLDYETIRRAKILAAVRGVSLSDVFAHALAVLERRSVEYDEARRHALQVMERGLDLGTGGRVTWSREDLYDRPHLR